MANLKLENFSDRLLLEQLKAAEAKGNKEYAAQLKAEKERRGL